MKIVQYLLANVSRLHVLNAKIEAFYDLWTTIYQKVAPLLPQHVAATAAVASAVEEAVAAAAPAVEDLAQ